MLYITARPGDRLNLGHEGENLARTIRFDISQWQALYGEGIVSLLHQRAGDAAPYPCAITVDGAIVEWAITNADTAKPSQYGKYELQYRFGDGLSKTCTGVTCVFDALGEPTEEPPEAAQGWLDNILAAGSVAEAERIKAEQAKADAEKSAGEAGSSATAAAQSAAGAKKSEEAAADSEKNAKASENVAKLAEGNAKKSETAAAQSATNAKASEDAAAKSAEEAKKSEDDLQAAVDAAALSARNAATYESGAKQSQNAAAQNASDALAAANAAKKSETASSLSERNAKQSETAAQLAATDAGKFALEVKDAVKSAVKSVNGKTPDEEGNVEIDSVASWNDLTDKPFGEEGSLIEVLPETTIDASGLYDDVVWYLDSVLQLEEGKTYEITFDGQKYTGVCKRGSFSAWELLYVGNFGLAGGEDTGEPVAIGTIHEIATSAVYVAEATNHTVSMKANSVTIRPIDPKYLPEALQFGEEMGEVETPLNIEWDGNTDGREVVVMGEQYGITGGFCKVLDTGIPAESLDGSTFTGIFAYNGEVEEHKVDGENYGVADLSAQGTPIAAITSSDGENIYVASVFDNCTYNGFALTPGLYFAFGLENGEFVTGITALCATNVAGGTVVHHIDPKYLPEHLQFGEEESFVQIMPEETVGITESMGGSNYGYPSYSEDFLEEGKTYEAVFDGVKYTLVCKTTDFSGMSVKYIGNAAVSIAGGDDTGEPFALGWLSGMGNGFFLFTEDTNSHTIGVSGACTVVHTIDPKYIKLGSGLTVDENGAITLALTNVAEVGA